MPNIYEAAELFRAQLLARDTAAAGELVRAYGASWKRIRGELQDLNRRIQAARAAGQEIGQSWLFRQGRLAELLEQTEREINQFARLADATVRREQAAAVRAAAVHAEQLTLAGMGEAPAGASISWARLPTEAMTDLVGTLGNGSPLRSLLGELGKRAAKSVGQSLITGLAVGRNPNVIAREIRADLGGDLVRAKRIARTETLRAYRTASLRHFQANEALLDGWTWNAALDSRTCAVCIAMHGTLFPVDEPFGSHPNCRCAPLPRSKGWAALGFTGLPDTRAPIEIGPDWFRRQPVTVQRDILGPGKLRLYQAGELDLADVVHYHDHPEWGPTRSERSLRDLRAA